MSIEKQYPVHKIIFVLLLILVLYFSMDIVIFTAIGIGIAVLLSPLLDILQRKLRMKRGYATLIVILSFMLFFSLGSFLFGQVIFEQAHALAQGMPEFTVLFQDQLKIIFQRYPFVIEAIKNFDLPSAAQTVFGFLFKGAQAGTFAIGGFLFAMILGIYLAVDSKTYFNELVRAFYPQQREKAKDILLKCAAVVRAWFRAQLLDMAIIGLMTTIGLWIVGVKYWALFGLLTAILGIIPYVGVIIVLSLVSFIVLVSKPSKIGWVLLVFFITQQIEGNIVLPMVMKGSVEIPEAFLIIMMLFFGFWFGLLGVFIAPPTVAVMLCLYRNLYLDRIES